MSDLNSLEGLFYHQLMDIYSTEKQLIDALPEMAEKANNMSLKDAFNEHLEETKTHKKRLDKISNELNIDIDGKTSNAMKGLINEAQSFIKEDADDKVKDAGMIAQAQRVEHYEISAYGTLVQYAQALNYQDIVKTLKQTQQEEKNADQLLNDLAIEDINQQATSTF
jgi:ferritin-like metal-binding protein YciE